MLSNVSRFSRLLKLVTDLAGSVKHLSDEVDSQEKRLQALEQWRRYLESVGAVATATPETITSYQKNKSSSAAEVS